MPRFPPEGDLCLAFVLVSFAVLQDAATVRVELWPDTCFHSKAFFVGRQALWQIQMLTSAHPGNRLVDEPKAQPRLFSARIPESTSRDAKSSVLAHQLVATSG